MNKKNFFTILNLLCLISFSLCFKNIKDISFIKNDILQEGKELFGVCANAIMNSLPPLWCWKKDGDAGTIPTDCPEGWFRSLALCYKNCDDDYKFIAGVCYKNCEEGYRDDGLTCYKDILHWYFKKSYIPESITNFDERVPCPGDMYKSGALCYRNCNILGLDNCGIGACSVDSETCKDTIIVIIKELFEGLGELFEFISSIGLKALIENDKNNIQKGMDKLGNNNMKLTYKMVNKIITLGKEYFESQSYKRAQYLIDNDIILQELGLKAEDACKDVMNIFEEYISKTAELPEQNQIIDSFDIFNLTNIPTGCDAGNLYDCMIGILNELKEKDPSGLLTIGMAFMKPICDVPEKKNYYYEIFNGIDYENDCIEFYEENYYKGRKIIKCESINNFKKNLKKSIESIQNKNNIYVMFENENYKGKHFSIGKYGNIENIKKILNKEDLIKSMLKIKENCLYIYFNGEKSNVISYYKEICENSNDLNIDLNIYDNINVEIYNPRLKVILNDNIELNKFKQNIQINKLNVNYIKKVQFKYLFSK